MSTENAPARRRFTLSRGALRIKTLYQDSLENVRVWAIDRSVDDSRLVGIAENSLSSNESWQPRSCQGYSSRCTRSLVPVVDVHHSHDDVSIMSESTIHNCHDSILLPAAAAAASTNETNLDPSKQATPKTVHPFLSSSLIANIMSLAYLFVPWAFTKAGVLLSIVVTMIVFGVGYLTSIFVAETCARAEIWTRYLEERLRQEEQADMESGSNVIDIDIEIQEHTIEAIGHELFDLEEDESSSSDEDDCDTVCHDSKNQKTDTGDNDELQSNDNVKIIKRSHSEITEDETVGFEVSKAASNSTDGFDRDDLTIQPVITEGLEYAPTSLGDCPSHTILHITKGGSATARKALERKVQTWGSPVIGNRKFELSDLCRIFLGDRWSILFTATTFFELFGGTWALGAIFGSSFGELLPLGSESLSYYVYVMIFAAVATPLTCMPSVVDQLNVQLCFLGIRMVMYILMITTVAAAFFGDVPHFDVHDPIKASEIGLFQFSNLHVILQITIWVSGHQFAIPAVAGTAQDKHHVPNIIRMAVSFVFVTTIILSILLSFYFGEDESQVSANLNWSTYHAGTGYVDENGVRRRVAWWAKAISGFVVIYPAIDGIGIFSLASVSLSEIVMGAWYKDNVYHALADFKKRTVFRLLGALPQLVCAMFVKDLSVIANYTGLFTIMSYYCCPCLLAIYSRRLLEDNNIPTSTVYNTYFSTSMWAIILLVLAVTNIIFNLVMSSL